VDGAITVHQPKFGRQLSQLRGLERYQSTNHLIGPVSASRTDSIRDHEERRRQAPSLEYRESVFQVVAPTIVEGDRTSPIWQGASISKPSGDLVEGQNAKVLIQPCDVAIERLRPNVHPRLDCASFSLGYRKDAVIHQHHRTRAVETLPRTSTRAGDREDSGNASST
jgi:hypothetical protein